MTILVNREPVRMAGRPSGDPSGVAVLVGRATVAFSALYLVTYLLELLLYAVQRPQISRLGLVSTALYAYTFVYFTSTVVYALVEGTGDWSALERRLGIGPTIHSALMIVAGIGFGIAVIRARVLPWWTGAISITGMLFMVSTLSLPAAVRPASAVVRDLSFAAMGAVLLIRAGRRYWAQPPPR